MHVRTARTAARTALVAALVLAGPLAACGGDDGAGTAASSAAAAGAEGGTQAAVPTLLGVEAARTLLDGGGLRIIDVRTPEEFGSGHIEGAENLDLTGGAFGAALEGLPKDATYFVYCRSGNRSATATAQMAAAGFTKVYELDGGVLAWDAAGAPLVP